MMQNVLICDKLYTFALFVVHMLYFLRKQTLILGDIMYELMLRIFVKDYKNTADPVVRQRYGVLSGTCGIICNLLLFAAKIIAGVTIGSMAVISDAFNNLSDLGSTLVTLVGIKLSSRKPDRDHPFGHGRFEYISALIVSFIIMFVGFELFRSSLEKIITPGSTTRINILSMILLGISVPVKLFMFGYNKYFGKKIDSAPLLAAAQDSINDCLATSAVIISAFADGMHLLPFTVDGFAGAAVSLLIIYSGFSVCRDTIGLLLGKAPDAELVKHLRECVCQTPGVLGIHDLIIHNYGPGRLFASVHAEVDDREDIVSVHEEIDSAERRIYSLYGCEMTIHMDPVSVNDPRIEGIKECIENALKANGCDWSFHDVRITDGEGRINVIFDLVVPFETGEEKAKEVIGAIKDALKLSDKRYFAVIQIDRDMTD